MEQFFQAILLFVEQHRNIAYVILFFGSVCEAIFPINFFIYGEVFFLVGGLLAGYGVLKIQFVYPLCVIGGMIGDSGSYFIGKKYGVRFITHMSSYKRFQKIFDEKKYHMLVQKFQKYGGFAVFLGRFDDPLHGLHHLLLGP